VAPAAAAITKNLNIQAQAVATTSASASLDKNMVVAATAVAQTAGNAALTKNMAVAGNAAASTTALLGIQVRMAAAVTSQATVSALMNVNKPISGAGDEITTVVAALRLAISLDGIVQSQASAADTTLYITKNVNGYALAQVVIVDALLRKLYTHSDISAGVAFTELGSDVSVMSVGLSAAVGDIGVGSVYYADIDVAAELEDAGMVAVTVQGASATATLETIEILRVA
jgi:hypothetical protein